MKFNENNPAHKSLINKIFEGEIILFTGSGFSLGAKNIRNEPIPNVDNLKSILIEEVISISKNDQCYQDYFNKDLKNLCNYCESLNKSQFSKKICDLFTVKSVADYHLLYGSIDWKKIYTLNIDDVIENILINENINFSSFNSSNSNYARRNDLLLYKLRGCVRNQSYGFTFSKVTYYQSISNNLKDRRFRDLYDDLETDNILFIGTSLTDEIDIDIQLFKKQNLIKNTFYYISPNITKADENMLRNKFSHIEFIEETTESFIKKLVEYEQNHVSKKIVNIKDRLMDLNFKFVNRDIYYDLKYLSPNMYIGHSPTWKDIFTNHDVITEKTENVISNFEESYSHLKCIIISDQAISGKSTMLFRIGASLSNENLVLHFNGTNFDKSLNELIQMCDSYKNLFEKKIYIIIDDASWLLESIIPLLNKILDYEITLLLSIRHAQYQYKYYLFTIENMEKYKICTIKNIKHITFNDSLNFIYKLKDKSYLGRYGGLKPKYAARNFLKNVNDSDILKSLYEFKEGIFFKKRIEKLASEILKHDNMNIKRFSLLLYILDCYGDVGISLELFLHLFDIKDIDNFIDQIYEIVNLNISKDDPELLNLYLKARYLKIVEKVVCTFSPYEKRDYLEEILINLSLKYHNYLKKYNSYYSNVFYNLIRSQNLKKILTNNGEVVWGEIFSLYKNIHIYYKDFFVYWLHRAISEMNNNLFKDAEIHLTQADNLNPNYFQTQVTRSIMFFQYIFSVSDLVSSERIEYSKKALECLLPLLKDIKVKGFTYALHTYAVQALQYYSKFQELPYKYDIDLLIKGFYSARDKFDPDTPMIKDILRITHVLLTKLEKSKHLSLRLEDLDIINIDNINKIEPILVLDEF
jgi:hypothetical protein